MNPASEIFQLFHETFLHGFVAARDPKNPRDTLLVLEEAEQAWNVYLIQKKEEVAK